MIEMIQTGDLGYFIDYQAVLSFDWAARH